MEQQEQVEVEQVVDLLVIQEQDHLEEQVQLILEVVVEVELMHQLVLNLKEQAEQVVQVL
jgi:hypothetical protein